jgi:SH3-like domain-containing protein
VVRGEVLEAGRTDPDNPSWRWCVNAEGLGGWLPEDWLVAGRAREDFDTTELSVTGGEAVTLIRAHTRWWLCRREDGHTGWLPDSVLEREG